ncbi:MAG: hypothetical protein JJ897_05595 [Marinibacterium sp.]|nr:hypothetical protein [Marinibacterium sp.]
MRTGPAHVFTGFAVDGHATYQQDIRPAPTSPIFNPAKEGCFRIGKTQPPGDKSLINKPGTANCAVDI